MSTTDQPMSSSHAEHDARPGPRPDVVIVGAGSAGCALAARLTEDPAVRVVVLEAGGPDTLEAIHIPAAWPTMWGSEVDWAYATTPQPASSDQVHPWPRGKVLGGSSSLNGLIYLRGHPADFDSWASHGCPGWDHESLLPLFKRMEDVPEADPRFRGSGGPLAPSPTAEPNPIATAFVDAARELGHPVTDDFNGERCEGAGFHDLLIKDGKRQSGATAYLHPASDRPNLEIVTGAHVTRLLVRGDRCTGVRYEHGGRLEELLAGEVVVCAGVIDSPALLLRSGIGPAGDLHDLGIDVAADVPGVGRNLHDHLLMGVLWEAARPVPPPEFSLGDASMFLRSRPDLDRPDLHLVAIHVPFHAPAFSVPEGSWTIAVGLMRPASRGTLRLSNADPSAKPLIDPAYLTEGADVEALVSGLALARELAAAPAFDPWRGAEALPGAHVREKARVRDFVRHAAGTYFHPVGTCAMGVGPDAVVDPELRVRGIDGLRVADASIMPEIVSANVGTAAFVIGEKAADLLRGASSAPVSPATADFGS